MKLLDLLSYEKIVIQCHDNPDPDTIAAGYALYCYFKSQNKKVRLIYSGRLHITKPNILMFIDTLKIPLDYVKYMEVDGLLITVDCQYGAGNVKRMKANHVAVIDHHQPERVREEAVCYEDIRNFLVSASTLVWDLMVEAGFDINEHLDIATALYYGLFSDSNSFTEVNHPLDRDMRDSLRFDINLIRKLKNSVLTLRELEIAGMALIRHSYNAINKFVVVKAQECDPNILGFISDLALQVDSVHVCVVYNEVDDGIKFSVRSCVREVKANELAVFLSEDIGSGGGHIEKAGGFISKTKFNHKHNYLNADEYFLRKLTDYYQSFDVIDSVKEEVSLKEMGTYLCEPTSEGVISPRALLAEETPILIRTLSGDMECYVSEDYYYLLDEQSVVHPILKEVFEEEYSLINEVYHINVEYFPSIRNKLDGSIIHLQNHTQTCIRKNENLVYARRLTKGLKLFNIWTQNCYVYGKINDYLVVDAKYKDNIFIVDEESFKKKYRRV